MGYISLRQWRDLADGHLYHEGDIFPFDGREIDSNRLAELETGSNRAGLRLIQADNAGMEQEPSRKQNEPKQPVEAQKTASEKPRAKRASKPKK